MLLNNLLVALLATSPVAVFAAPVASPDNSLAKRESAVLTNRATEVDAATIDMISKAVVAFIDPTSSNDVKLPFPDLTSRATDVDATTVDMVNGLLVSILNTGDENNIPLPVKRQLVPLPGYPRFANLFKTSKDLVKRLEVGVTTPAEIDEILASANLNEDLGKRQVDPAAVNGYFAH